MSEKLTNAMADLNEDEVLAEVKAELAQNTDALAIISSLQAGMTIVVYGGGVV